jgi:hypothetical protein
MIAWHVGWVGAGKSKLIDTDGIDGEDANWLFSGVAMNLLMEEAIDIADELEVSLIAFLLLLDQKTSSIFMKDTGN